MPESWQFWLGEAWARRRSLAGIVVGFVIVGVALAFVLPERYTAVAELLPPGNLGGRSQLLTQLTAIIGVEAPANSSSLGSLYPDIARSHDVLAAALAAPWRDKPFAEHLARGRALSDRDRARLLESVRKRLSGHVNPLTGLITLEFSTHDRQLSAAFLAEVLRQMEAFFANRFVTEAREKRLAIEKRLEEMSANMKGSEDALRRFLETNRITGMSPALQLQEAKLRREVELTSALYSELRRQQESARVEEVGTVPVLQVLGSPSPPLRRASPRRAVIAAAALIFGILAAGAWLRATTGPRP